MSVNFSNGLGALEEPGGLETVLINAGALSLLVQLNAAAEMMNLDAAAFSTLAIRRFSERASDEDWASMTSAANSEEDALGSFVVQILRKAVADANEVFS